MVYCLLIVFVTCVCVSLVISLYLISRDRTGIIFAIWACLLVLLAIELAWILEMVLNG